MVSASRQEVTAPELLAVGGVFFAIAMVWGILRLVDGLFGRSFGLVAMGLGAVALGAAVDIALTALGGRFPALTSHGIAVHLQDGRSITVRGLPAAGADRLLTSLVCDLRADHPAKE